MGRDAEKAKAYRAKWNAENTKMFNIRLCKGTDGDMIEFLDAKKNVAGYLKQLIRADMDAQKKE